jgi:excisionase family DNA binding protein
MANYDNKLGEWFKKVDAKEQELKARKSGVDPVSREETGQSAGESVGVPRVAGVQIHGPAREAPMSVIATMETAGVIADTSLAGALEPAGDDESAARLFAEEEVPQVEDFFSFLNRSSESPVVEEVEERVYELPKDQGSLSLSEGTGEPRPVAHPPASQAPPPVQAQQELVMTPPPPTRTDAPKPAEPAKPSVEPQPAAEAVADETQANWDRVPKHLQTLFGAPSAEVAQNSYKAFKETREGLIQRLLDPTVSLEEAARILNVCPTTVRRYTNRGVLKHYRTAGNQRRFKLSDVLAFMENGARRGPAEA